MVRKNFARFSNIKACVDDDSGALVIVESFKHGSEKSGERLLKLAEELIRKHAYVGVFFKENAMEAARKESRIAKKLADMGVEIILCRDSFEKSELKESDFMSRAFIAAEEEVLKLLGNRQVIKAS